MSLALARRLALPVRLAQVDVGGHQIDVGSPTPFSRRRSARRPPRPLSTRAIVARAPGLAPQTDAAGTSIDSGTGLRSPSLLPHDRRGKYSHSAPPPEGS